MHDPFRLQVQSQMIKHSLVSQVRLVKVDEDLLAAECGLQRCVSINFEDVARISGLTATLLDWVLVEKLPGPLQVSNACGLESVDLLAILECLGVCCPKSKRSGNDVAVSVCARKSNFSDRVTCDSTGEVLGDFRKEMLAVDGITVPGNATSSIGTCIQGFDAK